jgi:hypothetical protein
MRISALSSLSATRPLRRINKVTSRYSDEETNDAHTAAIAMAPQKPQQDISPLAHSMATEAMAHHDDAEPAHGLRGRKYALLNNLAKRLG